MSINLAPDDGVIKAALAVISGIAGAGLKSVYDLIRDSRQQRGNEDLRKVMTSQIDYLYQRIDEEQDANRRERERCDRELRTLRAEVWNLQKRYIAPTTPRFDGPGEES